MKTVKDLRDFLDRFPDEKLVSELKRCQKLLPEIVERAKERITRREANVNI